MQLGARAARLNRPLAWVSKNRLVKGVKPAFAAAMGLEIMAYTIELEKMYSSNIVLIKSTCEDME